MSYPRQLAIFHRQIRGDHALLALAQRRFGEAGLGAEYYPHSPTDLREALRFRPSGSDFYTVHLPRDIHLLDPHAHDTISAFAEATDALAYGLVVHDQLEVTNHFDEYVAALRHLDARLRTQGNGPYLLVEYAAGLEPDLFVSLHAAIRDCPRISACIDTGHIGMFQCQRAFQQAHQDLDVTHLKANTSGLRTHVTSVQAACRTALPKVVEVVESLSQLGKPLHFHLHDGHPSSTLSSYGVSDHLSFFQEITIPFSHRGRYALPPLYGPIGLQRIVTAARSAVPDDMLSFTLEIHPPEGRQPLGDYAALFGHWRDLANAERMQYWIEVLLRNHQLLQDACTLS